MARTGRAGSIRGEAQRQGITEYEVRKRRGAPVRLVYPKFMPDVQKRAIKAQKPSMRRRLVETAIKQAATYTRRPNLAELRYPAMLERIEEIINEEVEYAAPISFYHWDPRRR